MTTLSPSEDINLPGMLDSKEQAEKELTMLQIIDGHLLRTLVIACLVLALIMGLFLLIGAHAAHATAPLHAVVPCGPDYPHCYQ